MKPVAHSSAALLPFEILLEHLQRQGFRIGVEHHLRLRVLLDRVADNCAPSELKTLLCPLFATNAEQQNLFYRTFDTLYPILGNGKRLESYPKLPPVDQRGSSRLQVARQWVYLLIILTAFLTSKSISERTNAAPPSSSTPSSGRTTAGNVIPKTPPLRVRVPGGDQQANLTRKVDPVYPSLARTAGIQGKVRFTAIIGHNGRVQNLELVSGHPLLVESARQAVSQWEYKPTVLNGAPVEVVTDIEVSTPGYSDEKVILWWIVVLCPILLWLCYEMFRFRRRRLLIRKAHGKVPPYSWPIRTDFVPDIYDPHDLAVVSRVLHRRYKGEAERLDVARTVEASVAALGFPTFCYRKDSRIPEYLFLIDRASFRDHQAHWYEHLASLLRAQGLYVSVYFYEGDPRVCWNRSGTESLYLEQLQQNCAGHRLVVFGNGDQLLDAVTGRIVQWHGLLAAWPERALLTPEAPSQWGSRELTLATQFAIAPATLEGLSAVAGYFELPSSMEYRNWEGRGVQGGVESAGLIALRRYLGVDAFQWLCACAVYPDLQWDLTLCLGALPSMAPGLVCEENIVKLLRLDWFRSGSMPDSLRRALIAELSPETEHQVRGAIIGLLESNPAPQGTFASGSHQFQIAYQRYRNDPKDRKASHRLKALLENLPPDEVMQDYSYLDAAESVSRSPLQLVLPRGLLKILYPSGVPLFGTWVYARALLLIAVVIGCLQILRVLDIPHVAPPGAPRAAATIAATIQTTPADASVTMNGQPLSGTVDLDANASYDVIVSRPGYITLHEPSKRPEGQWKFTLDPEPVRLRLSTAEKSGKIFVDNVEKGELTEGMPDLEVPADGADHAVALRNGNNEILSFTFAAKPGETPRVSAPRPSDVIIVSSLGTETSVYSGSTSLRANLNGQEPQPIPAEGLKLSGVSATNHELVFSNKDLPKILIDAGNAPVLYVGLNADTNVAYLAVQSNVQTSRLFVDGREVKSNKPGNWPAVVRKPGQHVVKVTADGYDAYTQQVELVKDKPVQLAVELKLNVVSTTAFLSIEGGTPGAEVLVDGVAVKTLDTSGAARIEVTPLSHKIGFRKEHFESPDVVTRAFTHGQDTKLGPNEAKLKEMGRIQFQVSPQDAQVSYHRSDRQELQHAHGRDVVWVPEGKYAITAEAAGYAAQSKNDVAVTSGQVGTVELKLQPEAANRKSGDAPPEPAGKPLFEDPSQVKSEGGWLKATGPDEYVFLKAGAPRFFNLTFADPGKDLLGKQKKMEWVVDYEGDLQKVVYQFDGSKFERKATSGGKHSNVSFACKGSDTAFQFFVVIEPGSVEVKSPSCEKADRYESPDHDLTKGKIGIKRDIQFVIR